MPGSQRTDTGPAPRRSRRRRSRPAQATPAFLPRLLAGMAGTARNLDPPGHPCPKNSPARSCAAIFTACSNSSASNRLRPSPATWRQQLRRFLPDWRFSAPALRLAAALLIVIAGFGAGFFAWAAAGGRFRKNRPPEPGSRPPAAADDALTAQPAFGIGPLAGDLADLPRAGSRPIPDRGPAGNVEQRPQRQRASFGRGRPVSVFATASRCARP